MEGYLQKWTNYLYGYKQRYFVLKGNILYYYQKKADKVKGKIHLAITVINIKGSNQIQLDTGIKNVNLKCENTCDRDKWFNAMQMAKFECNKDKMNIDKNTENMIPISSNINLNEEVNLSNNIENQLGELQLKFNILDKNNEQLEIISKSDKISKEQIKQIYLANKTELMLMNTKIEFLLKYFKKITKNLENNNASTNNLTQSPMKRSIFSAHSKMFDKFKEIPDKIVSNNRKYSNNNTEISKKLTFDNFDLNEVEDIRKSKNSDNQCYIRTSIAKNMLNNDIEENDNDKLAYSIIDKNIVNEVINDNETFYEATETLNNTRRLGNISSRYILELKRTEGAIENKFDDIIFYERRKNLPFERKPMKMNIWSILKDSIGKELYKLTVPVNFIEPLSMLQRLSENFQYADLLNKASKEIRGYMRLALVSAFCLGGFSYSQFRTLKFFNPLLGETFELMDSHLKFRFFSEQVSHHPPISACYAEGEGFVYYMNSHSASNFQILKGALEVTNKGRVFINFLNFNETISYTKPKVLVKNLIKGKLNLDWHGKANVTNHTNGDYCEVIVYEEDSNKVRGKFEGYVKNLFGHVLAKIEGNIYTQMDVITDGNKRETIWKAFTCEDEAKYYFTDFAANLNNINEELKNNLPPTDSRLRPDQRALEEMNFELAAKEKERLEVNQRKRYKTNKESYKPLYFRETYDDETGELIYLYNKDYWGDRKKKNFSHFPKIYEDC